MLHIACMLCNDIWCKCRERIKKKKRREQPVSDKPGSRLFPECLSQDSLPLTSFFWFHKNFQHPNSVKDSQIWIIKEFFFSLTVLFTFLTLSLSNPHIYTLLSPRVSVFLLHPAPGQHLFFKTCGFVQLHVELPASMCHSVCDLTHSNQSLFASHLSGTKQERR